MKDLARFVKEETEENLGRRAWVQGFQRTHPLSGVGAMLVDACDAIDRLLATIAGLMATVEEVQGGQDIIPG